MDRVERQAARPDQPIGVVAINVGPTAAFNASHVHFARQRRVEVVGRHVVVIGLDDEIDAFAHGEQVAKILARVMARRAQPREPRSAGHLRVDAVIVAAVQREIGRVLGIADDEEAHVARARIGGDAAHDVGGRGDRGQGHRAGAGRPRRVSPLACHDDPWIGREASRYMVRTSGNERRPRVKPAAPPCNRRPLCVLRA